MKELLALAILAIPFIFLLDGGSSAKVEKAEWEKVSDEDLKNMSIGELERFIKNCLDEVISRETDTDYSPNKEEIQKITGISSFAEKILAKKKAALATS